MHKGNTREEERTEAKVPRNYRDPRGWNRSALGYWSRIFAWTVNRPVLLLPILSLSLFFLVFFLVRCFLLFSMDHGPGLEEEESIKGSLCSCKATRAWSWLAIGQNPRGGSRYSYVDLSHATSSPSPSPLSLSLSLSLFLFLCQALIKVCRYQVHGVCHRSARNSFQPGPRLFRLQTPGYRSRAPVDWDSFQDQTNWPNRSDEIVESTESCVLLHLFQQHAFIKRRIVHGWIFLKTKKIHRPYH